MEQYILYDKEFKLAICRACGCGISTKDPGLHFLRNHKATWTERRKEILTYLVGLSLMAPDKLVHPEAEREPVQAVEVKTGWRCDEETYQYCRVSKKVMERHGREKQGPGEGDRSETWSGCRMQTLLRNSFTRSQSTLKWTELTETGTFQVEFQKIKNSC